MKQIIILESYRGTGQGDEEVKHIFWFPISAGRRVPKLEITKSAYRDATVGEIDALKDGSVLEEAYSIQVPFGKSNADVKALLEARYLARQIEIGALPNPLKFYGTSWDGTNWT